MFVRPSKPLIAILAGVGMWLSTLLGAVAHAGPVLDEPILGGRLLVAESGFVTAEFLGSDAGYFNSLYLYEDQFLFNKASAVGSSVDLGWFAAGTELVFRLYVHNTGLSFYSGDAVRNPDQLAHALATTVLAPSGELVTTVGFEDLRGGGDRDYNDIMFRLTNVVDPVVPAPPVVALLGIGLIGLWRSRVRSTA